MAATNFDMIRVSFFDLQVSYTELPQMFVVTFVESKKQARWMINVGKVKEGEQIGQSHWTEATQSMCFIWILRKHLTLFHMKGQ